MTAAHHTRAPFFKSERLERRLLLATISGTKFDDRDGDGLRHPLLEPGLGGWTIYVDGNNNGVMDADDPRAVTAANGAYTITSIRPALSTRVREVPQAGWRVTFPDDGLHTVPLRRDDDTVTGIHFGNTRRGLVTGTVFLDENDDGAFDRGEAGQSGRTVFADVNNNGILDAGELSAVTDTKGDYALAPAAGTYTIRQVQQAGWWQTLPSPQSAGHPLTLTAGQTVVARNFGNVPASVDLLGAGFAVTSAIDPVPADGRNDVLYQIRNDGTADSAGFRAAFYLSDDATITTADTLLRSIAQGGIPRHSTAERTTVLTLPRPDPFQSDNEYWVGMVVDSDSDVAETIETNNANRGALLDRYPLTSEADLPRPVDNATVQATPIGVGASASGAIGDEWIGGADQDIYRLPVTAGHNLRIIVDGLDGGAFIRLYNGAWSLVEVNRGQVNHAVPANDMYHVVISSGGNGLNDPRRLTGRIEGPTGPYTLTIGAPSGVDILPDIVGSGGSPPDTSNLSCRIEGLPFNIAFNVALYLSDDNQISTADLFLSTVRVTSANYNFEFDFHFVRADFTLPAIDPFVTDNEYWVGLVVDSSNEIPERNETNNLNRGDDIDRMSWQSEMNIRSPADGQTPLNYSSIGFGNPLALSIGDEWIGPYDQDFAQVNANANETLNFDVDRTGGTLDSYIRLYDSAWNFLAGNDNGAAPGEAAGLDSFLRHSFSAGGTYWVVLSGRGNHTNHPLLLIGRTAASTGDLTLTITSEPAGDVTGIVFHDADADGIQDPGEAGLAGRRVYIDFGDEQFQENEPSVLTDADGLFRFSGLRPGTHTFRQAAPAGWIPTAPASGNHTLVLTSEQPAGPIAFGSIEQVTFSGTAYNDLDGDGTRDAGETGRGGVVAYADLNNNGVRDLTAVTVSLSGVPMDIRAGNVATFVLDGPLARPLVVGDVDVLLDVRDADYDVYLLRAGVPRLHLLDVPDLPSLRRNAWRIDDEAANTGSHVRPLDPLSALDGMNPAGKWRLVIEDHRNPGTFGTAPRGDLFSFALSLTLSEPFSVTDVSGAYTIDELLPGDYRIRAEGEADWLPTAPTGGAHEATLSEGGSAAGLDFGARQRRLQVKGRQVFYNNSAFDGRDPAANAADDGAIAGDKSPLAAGGALSHANITSYPRGINGVMVDVAELPTPPTLADFSFKVPSSFDPGTWLTAPAPTSFAVRDLPGSDHGRRVTFTWPDNLLRNVWLQVSVLANSATRRPAADVFYVGNLVGETGRAPTPTRVNAIDVTATRGGISRSRVTIDSLFDHNRDGWVNIRDVEITRSALGRSLPPLVFPASVQASGGTPERARQTVVLRRTSWVTGVLTSEGGGA